MWYNKESLCARSASEIIGGAAWAEPLLRDSLIYLRIKANGPFYSLAVDKGLRSPEGGWDVKPRENRERAMVKWLDYEYLKT